MSRTATDKQIAFYTSLVQQASALNPALAEVSQIALDGFPSKTVAEASAAIERAKATVDRLKALSAQVASLVPEPIDLLPVDLSNVPAGLYAVPGGDTRLKVEIDRPSKGKWAGFVFVKDGAVYGEGKRYGVQAPGEAYKGQIRDALRIIAADPKAASAAYGHLTSTCGVCRAPLENAESVARGIGPVCARKF